MTQATVTAVDVDVAGQAWRPGPEQLLTVRVCSRLAQPTQCELGFAAGVGAPAWPADWDLGASLRVRVRGEDEDLFVGEVTCVELVRTGDPLTARVRAYDPLHRLRKRQQPRVFTDITAAGLAEQLTADLGLTVAASERGPQLDRVVQHRQSDLALLVEVCAAAGLYPVVRGGTLHLVTLAGRGDPVALRFGATLWEARIEANLDRMARRITAIGWHPQRAETYTHQASSPRSGRSSRLAPDPGAVGVDGAGTLVDLPGRSLAEVTGRAQSTLDVRAATAVVLDGVAAGEAGLWAGNLVTVRGLAASADGDYVLTETTHTVDGNGYRCAFTTEPPEAVSPPRGADITLGRVTAVDDPDGLGRVRVGLPALGDVDVGWLGVLCPGAGHGRGLVALPDSGDTVLVALPHHSPADAVVLGSVYGTTKPPDPGVDGGAVRRWSLRTADGQAIVVDDAQHTVRVENRAGSYVELAPGTVRLHATTDLVIDAPGHGLTIRAATVDFEHAPLPITPPTS
jgi:phage protein D/phage baseplate assembly protein gpV